MRSFYKSPESVMLIKIYLIVITDQLRTTKSRSDQSHETKISRCLQSCRVLTRCWRPTSLSLTLLRFLSHTSHQNLSRLKTHPRVTQTPCVTQPFFKSRNLSSHHETPSASSLLMNMGHSHINQMEYQKGCE